MNYWLKKNLAAITLVILAASFNQGHCLDYYTPLGSYPGHYTSQGYNQGYYPNGQLQESCAPKEPCQESCAPTSTNCCGGFFLDADLLYWRAFEEGLSDPCDDIRITNVTEDNIVISTLRGKNHDSQLKWNLGFRVGVGYQFQNQSCNIGAYWTNYHTHSSNGNDETRHKWKLDLDVVDLLFRYECNPWTCCTLTPYFNVRYAQINQHLHKHLFSEIDSIVQRTRLRFKEDFWGVGPLLGIEADWKMRCGFSLYGNVAVGVLYGNFDAHTHLVAELNARINNDHLKYHTHAAEPVLDMGLGVRWKTCFCENKYLVFQLGVEEHRYFNHSKFCNYGDLSFCGGNFSVSLEF